MQRSEEFLEHYRQYQAEHAAPAAAGPGAAAPAAAARPLRALAIDGGGVRGLVPATILAEIEDRTNKPIWRCFDVISGTSTGGLLALALTAPDGQGGARWSASDLVDLYRHAGQTIFHRGLLRVPLTQLLVDKYAPTALVRELHERLGDTRLSEALTDVIITSWNLSQNQPAYFNSAEPKMGYFKDPLMRDVARATSAAPTFFRPEWIVGTSGKKPDAYIDGGVFANNPAKVAYLAAQPANGDSGRPMLLLSLGTGDPPPFDPHGRHFWGVIPWATPMVHVFMTAPSELVDVELRELADDDLRYYRLTPDPGAVSPHLDDGSRGNIEKLEHAAATLISEHASDLDAICAELGAGVSEPRS